MSQKTIENTVWSQRESDCQELVVSAWYILYSRDGVVYHLHHTSLSVSFCLSPSLSHSLFLSLFPLPPHSHLGE